MAVHVDASAHTVDELLELARGAARDQSFMIIEHNHQVSTADIVVIGSAGEGYVSFKLEPPPRGA